MDEQSKSQSPGERDDHSDGTMSRAERRRRAAESGGDTPTQAADGVDDQRVGQGDEPRRSQGGQTSTASRTGDARSDRSAKRSSGFQRYADAKELAEAGYAPQEGFPGVDEILSGVDTGTGGDAATPEQARREVNSIIVVIAVFMIVGALLNATSLKRTADNYQLGWKRDVGRAVADPLDDVSSKLGLNKPRDELAEAIHGPPPSEDLCSVAIEPGPDDDTPEPRIAEISSEDPLRVMYAGDSIMEGLAPVLDADLKDSGLVTSAQSTKQGSQLSSPAQLNWCDEVEKTFVAFQPDAVVVELGAGDFFPSMVDGEILEPGIDGWEEWMTGLVDGFVRKLSETGAQIYWLSVPLLKDDKDGVGRDTFDRVLETVADDWPNLHYVDIAGVIGGDGTTYSPTIRQADGQLVEVRTADGIHLAPAGNALVADLVTEVLAQQWPQLSPAGS